MAEPALIIQHLIGKPVSHVWQGHGSALLLEFGELYPSRNQTGQPTGEVTLMINWSWRIEGARSILGGSWSSERRWPGLFRRLLGGTVDEVSFFGVLPEILVSLASGLRVASFMTAEGQPDWAIIAHKPNLGSLHVKRGKLQVEPPSLQTPREASSAA